MQRRTQAHSADAQAGSSARSSTADYLHPNLRTALGCMDINLEAELARYRRQRPPRAGVIRRFFLRPGAPLQREELTAIATGGALPPGDSTGDVAQGRALMSPEELVDELKQREQLDLAPALAQQHPQDLPHQNLQQRLLPAPSAGDVLALGAGVDGSGDANAAGFAGTETAAIAPNLNDLDAETALALQNIKGTAALLNRTRPPELVDPSETLAIAPLGQAGTLARSPASVRQRRSAQTRSRQSPVSVLGVATIGVMAAGTLWTYITHYPDSDQYLRVGAAWNAIAGALDLPKLRETDSPPPTVAQREPAATGDVNVTPNLIRKELVDLDLRSLSTLGAKSPEPEPTASAQVGAAVPTTPPAASPQPSASPATIGSVTTGAAATAPAKPPNSASNPTAKTPTDAKAKPDAAQTAEGDRPADPPKVVAIPADGTSYYYVVVAIGGEAALTAARKVVPDAYVREFPVGARIQLGALDSLAQAQQLARQLQAAGIRPEIYHPQVQD